MDPTSPHHMRALRPEDTFGCDAIVASLPTFFGDPRGRRECAEAVRSQQGWVAETDTGDVVAFATTLRHFPETFEITWMAVRDDQRRRGLGRELVSHVVDAVRGEGCRLLVVLTLGPSAPDKHEDGYAGTRAFYRSLGFLPVREFDLSGWNSSAALLLALPIQSSSEPLVGLCEWA
jgi:GNAT superfamily N-acetyltransferase